MTDFSESDSDSIDAIRRGDREAFERLVKKYQRMVEAVAYSASGSRALVDDIVQDTFVSAWRTIDRLRDPTRVRAWLAGIARNVARNARRRGREPLGSMDAPGSHTPFDDLSERERDREIATALARLPASYREALVMFYYEHCTVKEVADALAVREDVVMQRLSRGRRRLGDELATTVEVELERKPSRAALAACVLLLLPVRAASAAPAASASWWHRIASAITTRKRVAGGALACALGAAIVIVAAGRSDAVARAQAQRSSDEQPDEPASQAASPPSLPLPEAQHTERLRTDGAVIHANISVASADPAETCARGARGLAYWVLGQDAYLLRDGELHFEPSPALERAAEAAATRAADTCRIDHWPELYVRCEGTAADIEGGTITCYPSDGFTP